MKETLTNAGRTIRRRNSSLILTILDELILCDRNTFSHFYVIEMHGTSWWAETDRQTDQSLVLLLCCRNTFTFLRCMALLGG